MRLFSLKKNPNVVFGKTEDTPSDRLFFAHGNKRSQFNGIVKDIQNGPNETSKLIQTKKERETMTKLILPSSFCGFAFTASTGSLIT